MTGARVRLGSAASVVAAALLSVSCTSGSSSSASGYPKTPIGTVVAYYTAIGHHDTRKAARLLAPEVRELYESTPDSDFKNVASLTNIRDLKEGVVQLPGGIPAGYHDVTQVAVTYDVVYKQPITGPAGTATRFVYVGRTRNSERWLILSIGSGP